MKKPRLTDVNRMLIETRLKERRTLYAIAKELGRPIKTIVREVKMRSIDSEKGAVGRTLNRCIHKLTCKKANICKFCYHTRQNRSCRFCAHCNAHCPDFVENICQKLSAPPYVCNGCPDERKCVLRKKYYVAKKAQQNYRELLVESRKGANITEGELLQIDKCIDHFTQQGQSIHAAMVAHPEAFCVSEKTIYRYSNGGLLSTTRGDLPRACMLKPRQTKSVEHKVDTHCRIGRTYADFQRFITENPGLPLVEMDTVEGIKGGKVLLTLLFYPSRFMVAYLLESKTAAAVNEQFDKLRQQLTTVFGSEIAFELFIQLFPLILTDNGSEFTKPEHIELDAEGNQCTKLFYCDPCASYQKAFVERNHEHIRKVLPKGTHYHEPTSFDDLTQEDINLMMPHINSYPRAILKDKTPYDLFTETFGETLINQVFNIHSIPSDDILLKPKLLGIEQKVRKNILTN